MWLSPVDVDDLAICLPQDKNCSLHALYDRRKCMGNFWMFTMEYENPSIRSVLEPK